MGDTTKYKVEDMVGKSFNKWLVFSYSHKNTSGNWFYNCKCNCGTESKVSATSLRTGGSKQCKTCSGKQNGRKGLDAMVKKHLYIITCGEYIKIGSSDNIERRITNLQGYNPYPIVINLALKDKGYLEPEMHKIAKEFHHHGEWFKISYEDFMELLNNGGCEI
jgi:hypothetical protein